jgi:hypothetical protein
VNDTMSFGQYRGYRWETIPKSYYRWLWRHVSLYGRVKQVTEAVLQGRPIPPPFAAGPRVVCGEPADPAGQIVRPAMRYDEYN